MGGGMRTMNGTDRLRFCCENRYGFLTKDDLADVAGDPKTADVMLLVRCSKDRFLAPARMVKHYIEIIEADEEDGLRDVCVPAREFAKWGGRWP